MADNSHHSLIILGSGPAGLTAALYAARADFKPVILEGHQPGGQLTITTDVENFPGFPKGVLGGELIDLMREQALRFGANSRYEVAEEVNLSEHPFSIKTDATTYTCDALIISTGATARALGLDAEAELMGYGVSACATCDGFFFREKEIIIVGGGDTAIEEAIFLTRFASKVHVIHRRDELRASKIMQERAFANEKIVMQWNSVVTDIQGSREKGVHGVTLEDTQTGETRTLECQGVFVAIGHQPNTSLFEGQLNLNNVGYLKVENPSTRTNVEGVFAAGDVMDPNYRQAITAAGTGCAAALDATRWLEEREETLTMGK